MQRLHIRHTAGGITFQSIFIKIGTDYSDLPKAFSKYKEITYQIS
jgi:hypothetical protein